jgi:hypothetical protein
MTDYLCSLLGHVARYGLSAEDAVDHVVQITMDEFAVMTSRGTGLSMEYLRTLQAGVKERVMSGRCLMPTQCQGRTQRGVPCKRMGYTEFCADHQQQGCRRFTSTDTASPRAPSRIIRPMRFSFVR